MLRNSLQMRRIYKMKNAIVVFLMLAGSNSYSQDLLDVMAKESCECIAAKNLDMQTITPKKMQLEFGFCILKSFTDHKEAYDKITKVELNDKDSMRKLGEQVALKMFAICPDFLMSMSDTNEPEEAAELAPVDYPKVEGEISEIITSQFVTIKVKDGNNRIHSFLFLDYFDSASLFTDNLIRKKDKVVVSYNEIELYDPKAKEFRYFKIITGLEKK